MASKTKNTPGNSNNENKKSKAIKNKQRELRTTIPTHTTPVKKTTTNKNATQTTPSRAAKDTDYTPPPKTNILTKQAANQTHQRTAGTWDEEVAAIHSTTPEHKGQHTS